MNKKLFSRTKNNKGQIQQVFIYIITIIIVGAILLIGYKTIGGVLNKGCEAQRASFVSDIQSFISKYNSYGDKHLKVMNAPCDYDTVCFVDSSKISDQSFTFNSNSIIQSSVKDGIEENIFIVKGTGQDQITDPIGFDNNIVIDTGSGAICIKQQNGRFRLLFEGQGKNVKVDYAPLENSAIPRTKFVLES